MRSRVAHVAGLTCVLLTVAAPAALAGPRPGGDLPAGGSPTATVENVDTTPGSTSGGGGGGNGGGGASSSGITCTYEPLSPPASNVNDHVNPGAGDQPYDPEGAIGGSSTGTYYAEYCRYPDGTLASYQVVPGAEAGGGVVVVDPRVLAERALQSLEIPDPPAATNPPPGQRSLVAVPTWLWLDGGYWQPRSATASAAGVSATVTAEPTVAQWSMGDGAVVPCAGPGTAWTPGSEEDASECAHTYLASSSTQPGNVYSASVTVTWAVSWTSTLPGTDGDLGELTRSAALQIPVAEVQALRQ